MVISEFQTPEYNGVWFSFHGDRTANREQIEKYLQAKLQDPNGHLVVNEQGPWWEGQVKLIGLSYSHAEASSAHDHLLGPAAASFAKAPGFTVLVFSRTHELGVDVESRDRVFKLQPEHIAKRYFHAREQQLPFLDLWLKKEAYAKATRLGLAKTIHTEIAEITQFLFKPLEKTPVHFVSILALKV